MNGDICLLVRVLCKSQNSILACALRISQDSLSEAAINYPNDEKEEIFELLPLHVKSCGPVIQVEQLFEVIDLTR